jgi:hypothetical protein
MGTKGHPLTRGDAARGIEAELVVSQGNVLGLASTERRPFVTCLGGLWGTGGVVGYTRGWNEWDVSA